MQTELPALRVLPELFRFLLNKPYCPGEKKSLKLVAGQGENGTGFYRFLCLGAAEGERSSGRPRFRSARFRRVKRDSPWLSLLYCGRNDFGRRVAIRGVLRAVDLRGRYCRSGEAGRRAKELGFCVAGFQS